MSRMIFCTFLQRNALGQDYQLYPGNIGWRIFNEISVEAWRQWMDRQTIIINERKLSMLDIKHRQVIEKEMIAFLFKTRKINIAAEYGSRTEES
ncbi:oxidative damage protection protein [Candidatus Erwinia haradaeae]|uniref:Probable Fe(2+)-trafficking protein n=1 Tax=Candidatus Erwinia haradaeae TaxID=1922217 RepID=A0A451DKD1_9GAMM|nr:oxidative damage protection protein [Candidatus Erwinia haradaeae]VFP87181.1 Probable Fe(2+)-trafficking protein [Candidatus Erwinia haradaeae]